MPVMLAHCAVSIKAGQDPAALAKTSDVASKQGEKGAERGKDTSRGSDGERDISEPNICHKPPHKSDPPERALAWLAHLRLHYHDWQIESAVCSLSVMSALEDIRPRIAMAEAPFAASC